MFGTPVRANSSTVLVHTIFYRPELVGVAVYTAGMCEWLARQGYSVRVVSPPPYYPEWRVAQSYSSWKYTCEVYKEVHLTRCPIWVPKTPAAWKRLLYAASFAVSSLPAMLREVLRKPNVVVVVEPSFLNAITSLLVAKLSGAVCWLHVQDFEIDIACDLVGTGFNRLRRILKVLESWMLRRFDVVSTISDHMMDRLASKGVSAEKCMLIPNWVDTTAIRPLEAKSSIRKELGILENHVLALFAGSMGQKQDVEVLIEAARALESRSGIHFLICGAGNRWEELQQAALGLGNVHFLPLQPVERLNDLLNAADVHLLSQKPEVAGLVMPSKLLGMLASGRPVVAAVAEDSDVASIVSRCGVVVPPGDSDALARAIARLADNGRLRALLGQKARDYALKHCRQDRILQLFQRELETVLKCHADQKTHSTDWTPEVPRRFSPGLPAYNADDNSGVSPGRLMKVPLEHR